MTALKALNIHKRNALNLEHIIIAITLQNQQTNSNQSMQNDIFSYSIDKCQQTHIITSTEISNPTQIEHQSMIQKKINSTCQFYIRG
jgi:hypothetical protein